MRQKGMAMSISKAVKVPPQFAEDFDLVADHYCLREQGEYETAKEVARNDLASAIEAFESMANQIRKQLASRGFS